MRSNMWINKNIIPSLIEAVEEILKANGIEDDNDIVIFESYVLPLLKQNLEHGFNSSEMLQKGFNFLIELIPCYLEDYGDKLSNSCFGELARLYYRHKTKEFICYLNCIETEYIKENIQNINKYVERIAIKIKL
ncbi:MAG: hypothetical protein HQK76_19600 [Desulfobacterales bacterium]|nr:hypothetical protein [Desulfobacterales bacterium]